jgi:hypothetical protein
MIWQRHGSIWKMAIGVVQQIEPITPCSTSFRPRYLDEATVTRIVEDAERFVARLERYLREVGAIE